MTQAFGVKYPIVIPSLTENADIQTALKVYHYGQATEPSTLNANSVSGHLSNLEATKVDIVPEQVVAGASNNLNLKITTGYYSVPNNTLASAGSFYPAGATAGMLHVINDGSGIIYQTYITNASKFYWRGYFAGAWTAWKEASDTTHSHAEFSSLSGQIANKQDAILSGSLTSAINTTLGTDGAVYVDSSGKLRASSVVTQAELERISTVTSDVQTQLNNKPSTFNASGATSNVKIFIQSSPPASGMVEGDLWFW